MPSVMINKTDDGQMTFYIPKKDLEEIIVSIEFDTEEQWGGEITLADGSSYYIDPQERPRLPKTLRAKRAGE